MTIKIDEVSFQLNFQHIFQIHKNDNKETPNR
jgi:hypothetical protein